MPIKQITPQADIEAYLQDQLAKREKSIIDALSFVGIQCVNEAKLHPGYQDQSSNLRSSIGFAVLKDGVVIHKPPLEQIKDGEKGVSEGNDFLSRLISENTKGIVLIVVAGMKYAAYVETNRNVITSAELLAERMVPQILKELGFIVK